MPSNKNPYLNFKQRLSKTVRPQDDLYRYVNGPWMSKNKIPPAESLWGTFYELRETGYHQLFSLIKELVSAKDLTPGSPRQKVRDFYLSMISKNAEREGMRVLEDLFAEIDRIGDRRGLTAMVAKLHLLGVGAFWDIYIDQDDKKSTDHVLRLVQSGLSLPERDYYLQRSQKMRTIRTSLLEHIPRMFSAVGLLDDCRRPRAIYRFELELARNSMDGVQKRDVHATYNAFSLARLQRVCPAVDWETYFEALGIAVPARCIVNQPDFFKAVSKLLLSTDMTVLKQYMKWHLLRLSAARMGERIARANFDFYGTTLYGIPEMQPLWKRAVISIDSCIGEALGRLYIDRYFPPEAKERMEVLIEDLRAAFRQRIENLDWMDQKTKQAALKKLAKIRVKIGYPQKLRTYKGLTITPDSYLQNYFNARIYDAKRLLAKLGQPVDLDEWHMTPQTVNAYYSPNLNEIVFPAGILQPPFFDFTADDAVNYGGIGTVIGHELTHGFDDQGCLFDGDGNLKNWWSAAVKKQFDAHSRRMELQGNSFKVLPGLKLNGKLTLGENLADLGGVEIAFSALQKALARSGRNSAIDGFTPEQRFFINYAVTECTLVRRQRARDLVLTDPHSPGEFRVNNTVRNTQAFHETFAVCPSDRLYLAESQRVKIW